MYRLEEDLSTEFLVSYEMLGPSLGTSLYSSFKIT